MTAGPTRARSIERVIVRQPLAGGGRPADGERGRTRVSIANEGRWIPRSRTSPVSRALPGVTGSRACVARRGGFELARYCGGGRDRRRVKAIERREARGGPRPAGWGRGRCCRL